VQLGSFRQGVDCRIGRNSSTSISRKKNKDTLFLRVVSILSTNSISKKGDMDTETIPLTAHCKDDSHALKNNDHKLMPNLEQILRDVQDGSIDKLLEEGGDVGKVSL
jgi:hypothetical protein